jgi:hypothetical protein
MTEINAEKQYSHICPECECQWEPADTVESGSSIRIALLWVMLSCSALLFTRYFFGHDAVLIAGGLVFLIGAPVMWWHLKP